MNVKLRVHQLFFKIIFINGDQFAHRMNREMVFAFHLEAA